MGGGGNEAKELVARDTELVAREKKMGAGGERERWSVGGL